MSFAGHHIVIAGGTKGIGRATAEAALAQGARVTATGRTAKSLAMLPAGIEGLALDFTDPASVAAFAARVPALDHLVLSASDATAWGPFGELTEDALGAASRRSSGAVGGSSGPSPRSCRRPARSRSSPALRRGPRCPAPPALRP